MANSFLGPSLIVPDLPLPGTFGGGILPSVAANTAEGAAALKLVPEGLTPVAVFPPYVKPRSFSAISVVWLEDTNLLTERKIKMKQKNGLYGLWTRQYREFNHENRYLRKRGSNGLHLVSRQGKAHRLKKKIKHLRKDIYCNVNKSRKNFRSRSVTQFGSLKPIIHKFQNILLPLSNFFAIRNKLQGRSRNDKCTEKKRPTFGFRTLITLVRQEPCILNVTCTLDGKKIEIRGFNDGNHQENKTNKITKKQPEFVSSKKFRLTASGFEYQKRKRRQTGEQITSQKPDCRAVINPLEKSCLRP